MRVSSNVTYNDFIKNLNRNAVKVQKTLNQLASLKEVSQSSDNPLLVSKIMNLNVALGQNATYAQEIKDSISWSDTQDGALSSVGESMARIRTLIQASGTATAGKDEIGANKNEIQQEIRSLVDSLNTNFDGRYVFAGQKTDTVPFSVKEDPVSGDVIGINYHGSDPGKQLVREISDGVTIELVTDGKKMMQDADGNDLSDFFNDVMTALNAGEDGDKEALSGELMERLDKFSSNFVDNRTHIGAVANRLKSAGARNETEKISLTQSLSDRQDVDIAEKYMEYQNQMLGYQTTMAMGTKIMQTTILDYVR
ncbi:MAG TPA: flagellar hook-associated protein FlgL [Candidatus Enterococcus avicola]|uniref:Flagellar hook-associated protein FlgL n=1 Tax=Candidatus Enterococcus avicola TaxID=2838561 RepID=A0A9D2F801_9ENTE|nr:flagellar hook-associated protein FlgL [Candidatus Enterococcus avicola]